MIFFGNFGVSGPTTDVVFAVQDFATGSATGNLDVTSGTLTGITPKAVLTIATAQTVAAGSSETAESAFGIGLSDGSRPRVGSMKSQDNVASTNNFTRGNTIDINTMVAGSATVEAASASFISGGVRYNFTTNDATSRKAVCLAFAGADVSVRTDSINLGTGTSAIDVTAPGFEPNVVFYLCVGVTGANFGAATSTSDSQMSFGIATWDGTTLVQRSVFHAEADGIADGAPFTSLSTSFVGGQLGATGAGLVYSLTASAFDSSGFSITPSANAGSDNLGYMALKLTGRRAKLVDITTPTSTGSSTISGAGFTPRLAVVVLTNLEALDSYPGATSDNQCGLAISLVGDEQWASSIRADSGAATTDTASNCQNVAILGPSATNTAAISATFTAWTSDGMTVNYSAVQANGKKGFVLFVE